MSTKSGQGQLAIFGALAFIFALITLPAVLGHMAAGPEKAKSAASADLSNRKPLRSAQGANVLKAAAAAIVLAFAYAKLTSLGAQGPAMERLASLSSFWVYLLAGLLLSVSYSLAQKRPSLDREGQESKAILYLRSFADDRETTLNVNSVGSTFLGVQPPYYLVDQLEVAGRTWLYRWLKIAIRYSYRFHPLFLVRLFFGNPKETSEQQLAHYLRHHGDFVAIGQPSEAFVTTGASRMYVTNDEWQQVVRDLLDESSFVVLQPSRSQGILWEVEQVFSNKEPYKILLCMVNYNGFQNDYEGLRQRMHVLYPERPLLPPALGNDLTPQFLTFNAEWEAIAHPLKRYAWITWPFRGTTANLGKTLDTFTKSVSAQPSTPG